MDFLCMGASKPSAGRFKSSTHCRGAPASQLVRSGSALEPFPPATLATPRV
jgi:hypothetical protein